MNESIQRLEAETEAIKQAYAALNRNDIDGFVKDFDPQIERVEFEGSPAGGTYRGIEAVKAHVAQGRSTWAEGSCEPTGFSTVGDKVVVSVHVRVRLKDRTDWLEGTVTDVFTFRDGRVTQFYSFAEEQQARTWARSEH